VIVVGLSHRNAPIEVRERVAVALDRVGEALQRIAALEPVGEAVLLSTCNRTEIYATPAGAGVRAEEVVATLSAALGELGGRAVVPYLTSATGSAALSHLFRVTASLDSLVVGEPQILGQVKEAARAAMEAQTLGPELAGAIRSAVQVARRVRTDTAVGAGQVSISSVAVDLARHIFEELAGHSTLLVGAGEMAESAAKLLARGGVQLLVVNRSAARGEELAAAVGGRPQPWEALESCLVEADIVVTSTASPEPVITRSMLKGIRRQRRGRSLFLIDIAVPRDVDPKAGELENVYLYDIDDLSHVVAESMHGREVEAARAEALVREEVERFARRRSEDAMKPLIVALRDRTRSVLESELERTCRGKLKHLAEADRRALTRMVDAAVNKLLHQPVTRLKQLAGAPGSESSAQLLRDLFDLEEAIARAVPSPPSSLAELEVEEEEPDSIGDDEQEEADGMKPRLAAR
jgi:glutamyl-tRNA reductase